MRPIHNFYNYEHRHDDRRRNNISNSDHIDPDSINGIDYIVNYYNADPDSYEYYPASNDADNGVFRTALWAIYWIAGGDPDGNRQFHCSDRDAIRATIEGVKQLRQDYDDCLDELPPLA